MSARPDDDYRPPHGTPPQLANQGLCRGCRTLTAKRELADHGGECAPCYRGYTQGQQTTTDIGDKRVDARDWAKALKRREEAGERLTAAQRDMWRAALHHWVDPQNPVEEAAWT